MQQVYDRGVYRKPHDRDSDKAQILLGYVWVGAGKCPRAVEDVVRRCGADESQGVCRILVEFEQLLADERDAEVDYDARPSDDAELQELLDEDFIRKEAYLFSQRYRTSWNLYVCL